MAIINQSNILNLQPGITAPVVVHMSEGDVGTKLSFKLIDGARAWTDPGNVVAAVHGRRQDGTQFGPYACTISGDVVSFETDAAIAAVAGSGIAQIVLTDSDQNTAGTANFAIMVERATFPMGVTYTNDVSVYEAILTYVQTIPAALTAQATSLQVQISNERTTREEQDAVLSARMDSFSRLPDGSLSTAADAELTDIRVMADGKTASTAGDAVREQVGDLKSAVSQVINNLTYDIPSAQNYYIEFSLTAGKTYNITNKGSSGQFTMKTRSTKNGADIDNIGAFKAGQTIQFTPTQNAEWLVGYANSATTIYIAEAGLIASDVEDLIKISAIHDSQIQYTLEEVQKYADSGKQRLPGFWHRGNIVNGALDSNIKYRAVSQLQHFDRDVTLSVKPGYRFCYFLSDSEGTYITLSPWYTTAHTIEGGTYFYVVVGESPENVSAIIDQNLLASTIVIDTEIWSSIVHLNRGQEQMVYNLKHGRSTRFNDAYSPLEFIHFSDIHASKKLWSRLCDYMDKYSSVIPFALHTGDYVKASQLQYVDLYAAQKPENGYILNCVGNHDTYADNNGSSIATAEQTYALLFSDTSGWDATFGTGSNIMYYYKDFADSGIRLIVLDQYYWDSTEESWLQSLLDDARTNNLAVITASHTNTAPLLTENRVACTFTSYDTTWDDGEQTITFIANLDTMIKAFKDAGGEHICHLSGHWHHDILGYTANETLCIAIECATSDHANWCDSERVAGTKSFDCFNVISADRSLHQIRLARIGNSVDFYGREKNILCYDYLNKTVIANS